MSEIDPEYLKHQFVYVPWVDGVDTVRAGKAIGLHIAKQHGARLTVLSALKSNVIHHDDLAKLPIVGERSGLVKDGGVVLAFCPSFKVMDKARHLTKSIIVLVEWPTENFEAWAKLVGAYNVVTMEVMTSNLSDEGVKALEGVVWEGYNGWHDDTARRLTTARLEDLADSDRYDRELVLAYARMHKGHYAIERLERILDKFEAKRVEAK